MQEAQISESGSRSEIRTHRNEGKDEMLIIIFLDRILEHKTHKMYLLTIRVMCSQVELLP